jgi:hypothetical protein
MYLGDLQQRLLAVLRKRMQNGDLSERSLAFLTGISQPHIHNVLKGDRILSLSATDLILRRIQIGVEDLLTAGDNVTRRAGGAPEAGAVDVPVLDGWLGPGLPLPTRPSGLERHPFPASFVAGLDYPVLARLAADPRMDPLFRANDLILLDHSEDRRRHPDPRTAYVINRRGEGLVRRVCLERDDLLVLGSSGRRQCDGYEVFPLDGAHLLDVIRARVVWVGRFLGLM